MSLPNQFIHVARSAALKGVKALIQIYTELHEGQGETTNMGKRWNGWMDGWISRGISFVVVIVLRKGVASVGRLEGFEKVAGAERGRNKKTCIPMNFCRS